MRKHITGKRLWLISAGLLLICLIIVWSSVRYFGESTTDYSVLNLENAPDQMCEDINWVDHIDRDSSGAETTYFQPPRTTVKGVYAGTEFFQIYCEGVDGGLGDHQVLFENYDLAGGFEIGLTFRTETIEGELPHEIPELEDWDSARWDISYRISAIPSILEKNGSNIEYYDRESDTSVSLKAEIDHMSLIVRYDAVTATGFDPTDDLKQLALQAAKNIQDHIETHIEENEL